MEKNFGVGDRVMIVNEVSLVLSSSLNMFVIVDLILFNVKMKSEIIDDGLFKRVG